MLKSSHSPRIKLSQGQLSFNFGFFSHSFNLLQNSVRMLIDFEGPNDMFLFL